MYLYYTHTYVLVWLTLKCEQGAGFGKRTALPAVALALQGIVGEILATAPANAAVHNFVERLDRESRSTAARFNQDLREGIPPLHHRIIVRAFKWADEFAAFKHLLKSPDNAAEARVATSRHH